ncbi:MAG TPA: Ig-like domain-containing protein, partial [Pyrinomonadaceae bacterium]|nr:Ig-like domain-containing protein [Pyrinomonadaceae bacterium]
MPLVPFAPVSRGESRAAEREPAKPQNPETAAATTNTFVNAPVPQPAPAPMYAPTITATKDDGIAAATTVAPGGTITYTVNVNNTGTTSPTDDATGVVFSDTVDAHTTLVPGSPVAAASDKYNTIGNVQITIPDGATDLLGNDFDPDTGNNSGMTATAETKASTACTGGCSGNVTINANGSFTYDPPLGFTGTDTFTYTANSGTASVSTTVTVTVQNKLWFINNNAGACTSNCDGRLSHPFTSLSAFNTANLGGPGQPGDNDWIFVFESTTPYTGPANLRLGQKFIGQDATTGLIALTTFTQPSGTDPIPAMASGNGTIVQINSGAIGISLNSGNMLRGFTVSNTTGAKISGNNFGTLIVGNSTSPDVTLNGTGQALSLTTGTLSVAGKFVS